MKRFSWAILAAALAFVPVASLAGVDNSHHDMTWMLTAGGVTEKCAYCHSKTGVANDATYGKVGAFCVQVCHIANSGPYTGGKTAVNPDAAGVYFYKETTGALVYEGGTGGPTVLSGGHQRIIENITAAIGAVANVTGTGWPHTQLSNPPASDMECTGCHAVHDNANPPFLNRDYYTFCQTCHPGKDASMAAMGGHPIGFSFNTATAAGYNPLTNIRNKRQLRYPTSATAPAPANLYKGWSAFTTDENDPDTHWENAGHLLTATTNGLPVDGVTTGGATGNIFGCMSCHNAHEDEISTPMEATTNSVLLLGGGSATDGEAHVNDACMGCHGDTAEPQDPGMTGRGHPLNDEVVLTDSHSTWTIPLSTQWGNLVTAEPTFVLGANGAPTCIGCHDVHGGQAGYMAIRNLAPVVSPLSACNTCHTSSFGVAEHMHHPGAQPFDYGTWGYGMPAWGNNLGSEGSLADGLNCQDCHKGDATSTHRAAAHNWL